MSPVAVFSRWCGAVVLLQAPLVFAEVPALDPVQVIADRGLPDAGFVAPSAEITAEELEAVNVTNTEDAIIYEPGVTVRKRYIGDAKRHAGHPLCQYVSDRQSAGICRWSATS